MAILNFFNTYVLMAVLEEQVPRMTFFKDRYFPTSEGDIFKSDKVLTEYRDGDRKLASFVAPRAGDIPMERRGYEIHELQPAYIAPSRPLTLDELNKRGFGEAIYANATAQERAARIMAQDLIDIDNRITRREEWMAAQVIINNGVTMQEYIDDGVAGQQIVVNFYDGATDHTYSVGTRKWDTANESFFADVKAMCRKLARRGLQAADLLLGTDAADAVLAMESVQRLLDKNSGIIIGSIDQELSPYDGVTYMGTLNFGGYKLNLISVDEEYEDETGSKKFFPATSATVTAPNCGHTMYGQISQIDYGSTEFATHAATRVPKVFIDQDHDIRKLRVGARPLAAPRNKSPYVYAANVVG